MKRLGIILALCIGALVFEKPLTAAARLIHGHINSLQGDWGSAGVMDMPRLPFAPKDNPKYICQWQVYTHESFTNDSDQGFLKVNWTWFEMDADNTYFSSDKLKWTVAHVLADPNGVLPKEERITSETNEKSSVPSMQTQFVSFGFIPKSFDEETETYSYDIVNHISIRQEESGLVVGDTNQASVSRSAFRLINSASIIMQRAPNVRSSKPIYPLQSQLHCEKLN